MGADLGAPTCLPSAAKAELPLGLALAQLKPRPFKTAISFALAGTPFQNSL
jgi:hypothetical protein